MKRRYFSVAVLAVLMAGLVLSDVHAQAGGFDFRSPSFSQIVMPLKRSVGWKYKRVKGKIYRRLYDYSSGTWIGEWELAS